MKLQCSTTCAGDTHGPLARVLLHCCSASEQYAAALCSHTGSELLRELLSGSVHDPGSEPDAEVRIARACKVVSTLTAYVCKRACSRTLSAGLQG